MLAYAFLAFSLLVGFARFAWFALSFFSFFLLFLSLLSFPISPSLSSELMLPPSLVRSKTQSTC